MEKDSARGVANLHRVSVVIDAGDEESNKELSEVAPTDIDTNLFVVPFGDKSTLRFLVRFRAVAVKLYAVLVQSVSYSV